MRAHESARKAHGVAATAREGTKHKNDQVLMSDVVLYVHCKDSVCFGGLWGVHDVQKAASSSAAAEASCSSCISCRRQIRSREGWQKPQKWQGIATNVDESTCRLLFSSFLVSGLLVHWHVCEENDTETEPLHFADGMPHRRPRRYRAGCVAPCWAGTTVCLRVVFTSLPS